MNSAPLLADFERQIAALSGEKALAAAITNARVQLRARWTPQTSGRTWMHEHAALLDAALRRIFALARERSQENEAIPEVAILATGGYGQKLLAPFSDLDLTFLTVRDDNSPFLHTLFQLTMDVLLSGAKIKIGYAYRTLRELSEPGGLAALDHQTQTALLDARYIAGDAGLLASFDRLRDANLHVADFLFSKEAERARVRSASAAASMGYQSKPSGASGRDFGAHGRKEIGEHPVTPFVTSPNVKEGPGGLRDVQTAAWMARVRWGQKNDALWRDLVRRKILTKPDLKTLSQARDFLLTVRCALHISAGERRDLLTPPRQEEVARLLHFADIPDAQSSGAFVRPGVEAFMERYYQSAFDIDRLWSKIKTRCLDAPLPLGDDAPGLSCVRNRVVVTDPDLANKNGLWPLRALAFCQTHDLELAPATGEWVETFRSDFKWSTPETRARAGREFLTLLGAPGNPAQTVRRMESVGLLGDVLPDLANCMELVPYDPTHAATVGEHSIRVLENLLFLRDVATPGGEDAPYYTMLREADDLPALFLAALLHDVGKKRPVNQSHAPAHHAEVGAEMAQNACAALGCDKAFTETVVFLVRNHLKLAEVSRLRDLSLPRTIEEVAQTVETPNRLRLLTLLTWADTQAVGPGIWNERASRLLLELFERTESVLTDTARGETTAPSETETERDALRLNAVRTRLQRKLTSGPASPSLPNVSSGGSGGYPRGMRSDGVAWDDLPHELVREHIEVMPAAYLLSTPPETIALHLRLIAEWQREQGAANDSNDSAEPLVSRPVLDMRVLPSETDRTALTIIVADDPEPGLLAKITGALLACDVRLHAAQVWTRTATDARGNTHRIALDTLFVDYHERPLGPQVRQACADALWVVLTKQITVEELLRKRGKKVDPALPALRVIDVDDQISRDYTFLDVEATDEKSALYRFAATFSQWHWDIHAARVSHWGNKARYALYLSSIGRDSDQVKNALSVRVVRDRFSK